MRCGLYKRGDKLRHKSSNNEPKPRILLMMVMFSVHIITSVSCEDEFPDINDIFKSLSDEPIDTLAVTKPPGVVIKDIDINLETLNISTFRKKVEGYTNMFGSNKTNETNLLEKDHNSRRLAWTGSWSEWKWASKILVYNKIYDLMLQTIYMARHKIMQIENDRYYNPEDTSYRIAFLYRNMMRINRKIINAYTTMRKHQGQWPMNRFLILHHKVAKLHVDFLYLWWVLIRLNERYMFRHNLPNTLPKSGLYEYTSTTPRM